MIRYLLYSIVALSLLACPSKPRRRPPSLPVVETDDASKLQPSSTNSPNASLQNGIYFALRSSEMGYQPQVLQATNSVVTPLPAVKFAYSKATPYQFAAQNNFAQTDSDLSKDGNDAINLLLGFKVGADSYCVPFLLAQVIQSWARGATPYDIGLKLQQARAQPVDISGNKGELKEENGVQQCNTSL